MDNAGKSHLHQTEKSKVDAQNSFITKVFDSQAANLYRKGGTNTEQKFFSDFIWKRQKEVVNSHIR